MIGIHYDTSNVCLNCCPSSVISTSVKSHARKPEALSIPSTTANGSWLLPHTCKIVKMDTSLKENQPQTTC